MTGTIPSFGGPFALSPSGSFAISAGRILPLSIVFTPPNIGTIGSEVSISVDSPSLPQPGVTIQLSGQGK